jgi:hypothetical protein
MAQPQGGGLPCPLLNGTEVVQQPIRYAELTARYVTAAVDFIRRTRDASTGPSAPWFLYHLVISVAHRPDT